MEARHQESRTLGALLVVAAATASCTSPWRLGEESVDVPGRPPALPARLLVAEASLEFRGRSFPAVAYLRFGDGVLRAHFGAESGLTILDLVVRGTEVEVVTESPLAGPPGMGALLGADLRRVYGDRSLFAFGGAFPAGRPVLGDGEGRVALPLADGSFVALAPGSLRTTLLGPDRVPEAEVDYLDPGPDGVPREVRLRDLGDGHRVVLEVLEVRP